eukprot:CAMPEP_0172697600 /NCGR_PEP_ID=MMETSP1074-20121228/28884_1 /TAXON_ID=2916 /ORGANISM="Ceratium fusus, Strain PA161109" /LENGTH=162 /DNA_ID=CAMNT_0013518531 /DNA_START=49 /DNA_END=534 /DNA_ORIENTATION=+
MANFVALALILCPAAAARFVVGNRGQSCDATCTGAGLGGCDTTAMMRVNTTAMAKIMIDSFGVDPCDETFTPFSYSKAVLSPALFHLDTKECCLANDNHGIDCSQSRADAERVCFCTPSNTDTTHTTTATTATTTTTKTTSTMSSTTTTSTMSSTTITTTTT